jgi:radical SAM protein (TIGR01212 family)
MKDEIKAYPWRHDKRYNNFSNYFKDMFSERVQKVSIDAGFTCPNRDGLKGVGGCSYCNNKTFKPTYCELGVSVADQVEEGIRFFSTKYKSMKFLAYFQAYTNTYAPLNDLIKLYEEALKHPKIVGLVIATRPDCLPDDVLDYLQLVSKTKYVMVEVGVESCEDKTLDFINRGHTFEEARRAIHDLHERKIHNGAHFIVGLPGEGRETILNQARVISELPLETLKLHQLQIHHDTAMAKQYCESPELFRLYSTVEEYIELMVDYLEILNPTIVVDRFVSQSPAELLIAPRWGVKNFEFVARLEKRLKERNTWQGRLYGH